MKVFCLFGDVRAKKSKSPMMHNKAIKTRNMDAHYVSFCLPPSALGEAMCGFRAMGFSGANVTIPHKENIIEFLDELSPLANRLMAVNTVLVKDNKLLGVNTDVAGFKDALSMLGFNAENMRCMVLGSGGAAKSAVMALTEMGASSVIIAGRNTTKLSELSKNLGVEHVDFKHCGDLTSQVPLIVNATPVSAPEEADQIMMEVAGSISGSALELVFDMNYGRSVNIWQDVATRKGCRFSDGLRMLAAQAARSFVLWTGESVTASEFYSYLG